MSADDKPKSKYFFLAVSVIAHGLLVYFIAYKALDLALPEGQVTSYEMNLGSPTQAPATAVDVVKTNSPAPTPKPIATPPPAASPKIVAPKVIAPKVATGTMPVKAQKDEPAQEDIPKETPQTQAQDQELKKEEETPKVDPLPTPVPVAEPTPPQPEPPAAPNPAPPTESAAPVGAVTTPPSSVDTSGMPGAAQGVQSDTVLTPYGSNRPISYPMMARMRKLEGETVVHYSVDATGAVTSVDIMQSSGSPVLDDQVVSTIKNWKFKPTGQDGVYERPVKFTLSGDAQAAPSTLRRKTN